jgi:hypothetical protein
MPRKPERSWKVFDSRMNNYEYLGSVMASSKSKALAKARKVFWSQKVTVREKDNPKPNSRKRTPASKRMGAALKKWVRSQKNPRIKLPAKWTNAKVRVDQKGQVQVKISASKVGAGRAARGIKSVKKA